MKTKEISKFDFLKVIFRSFFIQSSWNFKGMQNLGFAFSIKPIIYKLYVKNEDRLSALKRHLGFFNTHPYFVTFLLGSVIRMEEMAEENTLNSKEIGTWKNNFIGPFGAIGDSLFWATLKPFLAIVSVFLVLMGKLWAPIFFLVLYNIPHLLIRFGGLWRGYYAGENIAPEIKRYNFQKIVYGLKVFTIIILGIFTAKLADSPDMLIVNGHIYISKITTLGIVFLLFFLLGQKMTPAKLVIFITVSCILFTYLSKIVF